MTGRLGPGFWCDPAPQTPEGWWGGEKAQTTSCKDEEFRRGSPCLCAAAAAAADDDDDDVDSGVRVTQLRPRMLRMP